ncbi:MAG: hypothetical protein PHY45_15380 [Rhodocyclaceae bacterium]|nr:hypothetical protein [Rhodocyclaceae bacterium]
MNRTALKDMTERMFTQSQQRYVAAAPESKSSKRRETMNKNALSILCLALVLGLAGCASPTPMLDESFGDSVREARAAQTLHPDASLDADPVAGLDGVAANEAIGRYHDSFKTPPPVTNVINIGGVVGGGN